jgi:hypothetical protein
MLTANCGRTNTTTGPPVSRFFDLSVPAPTTIIPFRHPEAVATYS